ncbi:MAG TPA: sigma-70 family RNA polymerase sigma factor [Polyangiaceae bacterium]|nr:sigma-70 family RNA polymerase sigma factor [Polyangiaceae bacterium]
MNSPDGRASNRVQREADAELDRELIQRAQSGDTAAFRQLVERHQRRAFAIAVALVKDEEEAREVVQEAFIRVYRGLERFHGGSSFFTWLYRIVTNLAIDVIRKPSRRDTSLEETIAQEDAYPEDSPFSLLEDVDPLDAMHRGQLRANIEAALEELPPYHRSVIVMREVLGMSYEEMAEAMSVSKGTIMSRLFHARRKLQKTLLACYVNAFDEEPELEETDKP